MIERALARRVLGLSADADEIEIQNAYRALRAHLQARLTASDSQAFQEARHAELRDLERVLRALCALPIAPGFVAESRTRRGRGSAGRAVSAARGRLILGWAVLATLFGLALLAYVFSQPGTFGPAALIGGGGDAGRGEAGGFAVEAAPSAGAQTSSLGFAGDVESAGARAQVVARSTVEGAVLQVESRAEVPELVAEGAADETVYWLAPGRYTLRVAHADCADGWERELSVRGGEHHEFAPELCQGTGWVVVRSNQANDQLSIDGRKLGATTAAPRALPVGEHELRVEKAGYETWEGLVDVAPGKVLAIRPRLARRPVAKPRSVPLEPQADAAARSAGTQPDDARMRELGGWHQEAMQWLLARYDNDRSGLLDSVDELLSIPCDQWLSLEQSYDNGGLGLSLTRFYGFDGERWRPQALGIGDGVRDVAYERMKECGLE